MRGNTIAAEVDLVSWNVGRDLVRGGQVRERRKSPVVGSWE